MKRRLAALLAGIIVSVSAFAGVAVAHGPTHNHGCNTHGRVTDVANFQAHSSIEEFLSILGVKWTEETHAHYSWTTRPKAMWVFAHWAGPAKRCLGWS